MESLHDLLREQVQRLLHNKSTSVCTLSEKQVQCDTFNLGCLMRTFPFLCDPQALDDARKRAVTSTIEQIGHIGTHGHELTFHQWGQSHNTADHAGCSLDKILLPKATKIMQSTLELTLPSLGSSSN